MEVPLINFNQVNKKLKTTNPVSSSNHSLCLSGNTFF